MLKTQSDIRNVEVLARYDFLDLCVLGKTGIGKTHTAKLLHDLIPKATSPFVAVN